MRLLACLVMIFCGGALAAPAQTRHASQPLARARQLIVVTTPDWAAVDGTLQRYARSRQGWRKVGRSVPVVVGRTGLAWGRGVLKFPAHSGPVKHEGDGKSPAGLFRFGTAFGYDARPAGWRVSYRQMSATSECVDDSNSRYYNRVLDGAKVTAKDWASSEQMRRADEFYRWGLVVAHNYGAQTTPGGGSCIFMHVWGGPGQGTAGCTALDAARLRRVIGWLRPAARPLLLQLPARELARWSPARRRRLLP